MDEYIGKEIYTMKIKKLNKCFKNKLLISTFSLILVLMTGLFFKIDTYAAQDFTQQCDGVVEISLRLIVPSGDSYELKHGCAICIGDESGGISNVVTTQNLVLVTAEELAAYCDSLEIPEEERKNVRVEYLVCLTKDIAVSASVYTDSTDVNMAVLKLSQPIFNHTIFSFDLDHDIAVGDPVYAIGCESYGFTAGVYSNQIYYDRNSFLQHDIEMNRLNEGGALLNEAGELIGMNQTAFSGGCYYSIDIQDIASILTYLGIYYPVADHTDYSADFSSLESAVMVTSNIDLSGYTEKTRKTMSDAIVEAQVVLANEEATQEEVDLAYENLLAAQNGLKVDKSLSLPMILALIGIGVLLLVIIGMILFMILSKKKRLKKEKEAAEFEAKKPEIATKPYSPLAYAMPQYKSGSGAQSTDFSSGNMSSDSYGNNYQNTNISGYQQASTQYSNEPVSYSQQVINANRLKPVESRDNSADLRGFAHLSERNSETVVDNTTVLDENFVRGGVSRGFVLQGHNQSYVVNRQRVTVGKFDEGNDIILKSSVVSRQHAVMFVQQEQLYVQDLGSRNGTYINGKRVDESSVYIVKPGDELAFADQIFIVYEG